MAPRLQLIGPKFIVTFSTRNYLAHCHNSSTPFHRLALHTDTICSPFISTHVPFVPPSGQSSCMMRPSSYITILALFSSFKTYIFMQSMPPWCLALHRAQGISSRVICAPSPDSCVSLGFLAHNILPYVTLNTYVLVCFWVNTDLTSTLRLRYTHPRHCTIPHMTPIL